MLRRILLVGLVGPALSLSWIPVSFATLASASLDWSQLHIDVLAIPGYPAPALSFINRASSLSTGALTVGDSSDSHTHNTFNWTSAAQAESITPGARAIASASNEALHTRTSATPPTVQNLPFPQPNTANAQAGRNATLRLDGPAALVFSMPYELEVSGALPFDFDDYAMASVSGMASFQPDVGSAYQSASRGFSLDSRFDAPMAALNGSLLFGLVIDGAGTVSVGWTLTAGSVAQDFITSVPEPSAILQMLAGLFAIGVVAVRRSFLRWPA